MTRLFAWAMLLAPNLAFSQLDPFTVTVGASRPLSSPPDLVTINLSLTVDINSSADDVLATLKDADITIANLTGVSVENVFTSTPNGEVQTQLPVWAFSIDVPLATVNSNLVVLAGLQNAIIQKKNNWALSFYEQGLKTSLANTARCSIPDLLLDARAYAQQLASAIGFGVGQVAALGDAEDAKRIFSSGNSPAAIDVAYFVGIGPILGSGAVSIATPISSTLMFANAPIGDCSIVVKFRLIGGI